MEICFIFLFAQNGADFLATTKPKAIAAATAGCAPRSRRDTIATLNPGTVGDSR
jgi:hypothetical protein